MTTTSFANLPDTIFCSILEYLNWYDVGRFDNALLNRKTRRIYLDALKIRKVKINHNDFRLWWKSVDKGILDWLISRNIQVISWHFEVDNTQLMTISNGCPQWQSLDISGSRKITDKGIKAVANKCPQLQSLNIFNCDKITDEGIKAVANGLRQLQSLNICECGRITDEGIKALANGLRQLQSLNISNR